MKKLIQSIAFLVSFLPVLAMANPATETVYKLFGNPAITSPQDCTPGTSSFCSCWATTIINGCIASGTHNPAWCTVKNIDHEVRAIGVARACNNNPVCITDFNAFFASCGG